MREVVKGRAFRRAFRTLKGISRDGGATCKSAVQGDWQWREPKTKLATSEEDATELFIINMALEFLFSPWDVVINIRDGRPGTQERRRHPGVGEANQHKHAVKLAPGSSRLGRQCVLPAGGSLEQPAESFAKIHKPRLSFS